MTCFAVLSLVAVFLGRETKDERLPLLMVAALQKTEKAANAAPFPRCLSHTA